MLKKITSRREAISNICYAVSLTAIMASCLFLTVGINPKSDSFGYLPWCYAGLSVVSAVILFAVSRTLEQPAPKSESDYSLSGDVKETTSSAV